MEITENIQAESTNSQVAEAKDNNGDEISQVSYGKFKNVNSLINAYNSLQSEFTRRSQKLKELEGAVINDKTDKTQPDNLLNKPNLTNGLKALTNSGVDVLKDFENNDAVGEVNNNLDKLNVPNDNVLEKEVEEFLNKYPEACKYSKSLAEIAEKNNDFNDGFLHRAYMQALKEKADSFEKLKSDDGYLLELIDSNTAIKDSVIKKYLNSIKNNGNVSLLSEIGSGITMPVKRPATIEEAGLLAKDILKKK